MFLHILLHTKYVSSPSVWASIYTWYRLSKQDMFFLSYLPQQFHFLLYPFTPSSTTSLHHQSAIPPFMYILCNLQSLPAISEMPPQVQTPLSSPSYPLFCVPHSYLHARFVSTIGLPLHSPCISSAVSWARHSNPASVKEWFKDCLQFMGFCVGWHICKAMDQLSEQSINQSIGPTNRNSQQ